MKVDTEVRHVTKAGANLFLDLRFAPAEANRLHAASREQIIDKCALEAQRIKDVEEVLVPKVGS